MVIPKEIRRTMRIREGDPLEIFTDKDGELIFKKYSPIGELPDFAGQLCDSMRRATDGIAAVCDRDGFIAVAGGARRELLDKPLSPQLSEIMDSRAAYARSSGSACLPAAAGDDKYCLSAAVPIISEGDVLGCVSFIAPRGDKPSTEVEQKLALTVAGFLGKQLES